MDFKHLMFNTHAHDDIIHLKFNTHAHDAIIHNYLSSQMYKDVML